MKFKPFSQDPKQAWGVVGFGVEPGKGSDCTMEKEHKVMTGLNWGLGFLMQARGRCLLFALPGEILFLLTHTLALWVLGQGHHNQEHQESLRDKGLYPV